MWDISNYTPVINQKIYNQGLVYTAIYTRSSRQRKPGRSIQSMRAVEVKLQLMLTHIRRHAQPACWETLKLTQPRRSCHRSWRHTAPSPTQTAAGWWIPLGSGQKRLHDWTECSTIYLYNTIYHFSKSVFFQIKTRGEHFPTMPAIILNSHSDCCLFYCKEN